VKKRILILTASFGEGHNSAARGVRDGLARVAPEGTQVELHDLFAEAYGPVNELVRKSYLALVNFAPRAWGVVYRWLDRKKNFDQEFAPFSRLKDHFTALLDRFQPDIVICTLQEKTAAVFGPAKVWLLSRIQLPSMPPGIDAPPIISSLQTNKAPQSCGQSESTRKKSRCLDFP
jgi:Monogalactosyldiacylglycerol (MGDG) synthase